MLKEPEALKPQFSLKQILILVTVAAVLLSLLPYIPHVVIFGIVLGVTVKSLDFAIQCKTTLPKTLCAISFVCCSCVLYYASVGPVLIPVRIIEHTILPISGEWLYEPFQYHPINNAAVAWYVRTWFSQPMPGATSYEPPSAAYVISCLIASWLIGAGLITELKWNRGWKRTAIVAAGTLVSTTVAGIGAYFLYFAGWVI